MIHICIIDKPGKPSKDCLTYDEICKVFNLPDREVLEKLIAREYRCIPISRGCCYCDERSLFNIMVEENAFDENGDELPW